MNPQLPPHQPVMVEEVLRMLQVHPDGVYVDATVGAGGHAARIASLLRGGCLIGLDRDETAIALARRRLREFSGVRLFHANYSALSETLAACGISRVDGVLLDAGCSSMQLDTPSRGFSFQEDGPLDMRMDGAASLDAATWLSRASRAEIASALRQFGDVGPAQRIARVIEERRAACRMSRTSDLVEAVSEALDFVTAEPAEIRTVFQAVRMAVNEELKHLEAGLRQAVEALRPGGRIVAISFHSGEDRVVKRLFQEHARVRRQLRPDGRMLSVIAPTLRLVTSKPLQPSPEETMRNPRAKSARLRAAERAESESPDQEGESGCVA